MAIDRIAPAQPRFQAQAAKPAERAGEAAYAQDELSLSRKDVPIGLSELDAANKGFWPRYAGGALVALGGLGITSVGVIGVATLPYAAFAGLFLGGLAVCGAGLYLAWTGAKAVIDAKLHLKGEGV